MELGTFKQESKHNDEGCFGLSGKAMELGIIKRKSGHNDEGCFGASRQALELGIIKRQSQHKSSALYNDLINEIIGYWINMFDSYQGYESILF